MSRLPLFIFIHAFGWEILRSHPDFLDSPLSAHPPGRILADDELRQLGVFFPDHQYGEMVFPAHGGVLIVPSFMGAKRIAGMHGYHPDEADASAMICSNLHLPEDLESIEHLHRLMRRHTGLEV